MSYYRLQPRGGRPAAGAAPALPVVCLDELHTLTVQTAVSGTASLLSYHMDKLFGRRDLAVVFCRWKRTIWINSSVGGSAAPLSHFFHVFSLLLPHSAPLSVLDGDSRKPQYPLCSKGAIPHRDETCARSDRVSHPTTANTAYLMTLHLLLARNTAGIERLTQQTVHSIGNCD